jgi:hypothetical protein
MDGSDFITTFFDGKLPASALPITVMGTTQPLQIVFNPDPSISRRNGITLDANNRTLTVTDGGYYLVNWDSVFQSKIGTPNQSLWAIINEGMGGISERYVELGGLDNVTNDFTGNHIVYLNRFDTIAFEFAGGVSSDSFTLENLVIDVSQLNSWQ